MENINDIFYINEININNLIKKIKSLKINNQKKLNEEIIKLKKIINEKDQEILKYKNNNFLENDIKNINNKNIAIIGEEFSGKTLIINNFKNIL